MRRLLFLDLDDTLFHSRRKVDPAGGEPVGFASDGSEDSFMRPHQRAFFDWISDGAEVIPTTGRSVAAYQRVRLPFTSWAICAFGGVILRPDGTVHLGWREQIAGPAEAARERLAALNDWTLATGGVRARVIEDDGLPLYVSVKTDVLPSLAPLGERLRPLLPAGWRLHIHGPNLAILPAFLGKELAVRWFLDTVAGPDTVTFGVGDSVSDGPFMALCDFAITPGRAPLLARALG